jgi:hypothetical protein
MTGFLPKTIDTLGKFNRQPNQGKELAAGTKQRTSSELGALKNPNTIGGCWGQRMPQVGELEEQDQVAGLLSRKENSLAEIEEPRANRSRKELAGPQHESKNSNTEKQIGPAKLNGRTVLQRKTTRKTWSEAAKNCARENFLAAATELRPAEQPALITKKRNLAGVGSCDAHATRSVQHNK